LNPVRGVRVSFKIWGCITYEGVSALTVVDGNSNAQNYIEVIDYFVWPVITRHLPDNKYVFQGDNGPIHRACVVKEYMEEAYLHGKKWPAHSLDLNIIENIYVAYKQT
jgi:hypothetical protein